MEFFVYVLFNSSEHAFVKNFVNDWANLGTLIERHLDQPGHSRCLEISENCMSIAEGQKDDVMSMLSSAFQDKITRNRSILHSILKTIYLCGKQNIPLRGHIEEKSNFIALINYRAETYQILATHLQNSPPNARYLSPTIQNELIDMCGRQLQQVIVSECKVMMGLQIWPINFLDFAHVFKPKFLKPIMSTAMHIA
jgi:hypothetical protein